MGNTKAKEYNNQGLVQQRLGNTRDAITNYKKAIDADPQMLIARINLSQILNNTQQYDQAIVVLDECLKIDPKYAQAFHNKGVASRGLGNLDEAILNYKKAIETDPQLFVSPTNLSSMLISLKRYDEAIEVLDQWIKIEPSARAYFNKGEALRELGKIDEAIIYYKKAIKADPQLIIARTNLIFLLINQQNYEQTVQDDQCIKINPEGESIQLKIEAAFNKLWQRNKAKPQEDLDIEPQLSSGPIDLSQILINNLRTNDDNILIFDTVIKGGPQSAQSLFKKGLTFRLQNQLKSSLIYFDQSVKHDALYIQAWISKAEAGWSLGFEQSTFTSLQKVKELLDDSKACKKLSLGDIQKIRGCVTITLDFESNFQNQAVEIKKQTLQQSIKLSPEIQDTFTQQLQELQNKKFVIIQAELQKINDPKIIFMSNFQSNDDDIKNLFHELKQLKIQNQAVIEMNQEQQLEFLAQQKTSKRGIDDIIKIKDGWGSYEKTSPRLKDYSITFYWTLLDYISDYKTAQLGIFQQYTNNTEKDIYIAIQVSNNMLKCGSTLATNLPFLGGVSIAIFQAIEVLFSVIKENRSNHRVSGINFIVNHNNDPDTQTIENLCKILALTAQEISDRKYQIDTNGTTKIIKQNISGGDDYLQQLITPIIKYATDQEICIYSTEGGSEALKDVLLLLIHLTLDHENIIKLSNQRSLYLILADSVMQRKSFTVFEEISQDQSIQMFDGVPKQSLTIDTHKEEKCPIM